MVYQLKAADEFDSILEKNHVVVADFFAEWYVLSLLNSRMHAHAPRFPVSH